MPHGNGMIPTDGNYGGEPELCSECEASLDDCECPRCDDCEAFVFDCLCPDM